jgi:hypothetical protein
MSKMPSGSPSIFGSLKIMYDTKPKTFGCFYRRFMGGIIYWRHCFFDWLVERGNGAQ